MNIGAATAREVPAFNNAADYPRFDAVNDRGAADRLHCY